MDEQKQLKKDLVVVLKEHNSLYKIGVCHDPLIYSIIELIQESYEKGRAEGFEEGDETGFKEGESLGYAQGYDEGYQEGYEEGFIDGRS